MIRAVKYDIQWYTAVYLLDVFKDICICMVFNPTLRLPVEHYAPVLLQKLPLDTAIPETLGKSCLLVPKVSQIHLVSELIVWSVDGLFDLNPTEKKKMEIKKLSKVIAYYPLHISSAHSVFSLIFF